MGSKEGEMDLLGKIYLLHLMGLRKILETKIVSKLIDMIEL
jgi:hypothetical protein